MQRAEEDVMRNTVLAIATLALATAASAASSPDWTSAANVETIRIRTTDADGSTRERTVWLLVHDGQGFVRAGSTSRWDGNVDAVPDVSVQIGETWYDLRATRIPEGAVYDAVMAGMREKYGWQDAVLSPLRFLGGSPRILRLDPRAGIPMGTPP
jgi:hypothetical protein